MNLRVTLNEQERTFNLGFDAKYAGGGTSDHSQLMNRDAADQHPLSAITDLEEALDGKQPKGEYLTEHQPIKTINGMSLVGEGNIQISGGDNPGDYTDIYAEIDDIKETLEAHENAIEGKQPKGDYLTEHQKIKTINGESLVGDGDIQIIVEAPHEEILVADLSAAVRMVAEGDPLSFVNHNGSMILCATTANDAAFMNRTSETKYLIPIPSNADSVKVETTDEKVTMMQFVGVKVNGSAYDKVFATERSAERSCQFEKGAADYIAINMIYEDTGAVTVPWDYDVTKTTTVAFNVSASGGLPAVTTADNDKLLQVVDGKWTAVALKGSTIETYINEYIGEALGGEY